MPPLDKLIERIKARPPEADFSDVRQLLEGFGWALAREKGSHAMFTKEGQRTIAVPKVGGRKVKRTYLNQICEILGLEK
ncbi:MAG: type II toxin-antitoxin system HicA family toxin [Chloroflexi bacterium]|nr:type II toxin-antitoxin system HicA family toxin [Chloroflexota bacterium]